MIGRRLFSTIISEYAKRPSCVECAWNMVYKDKNLCTAMASHDLVNSCVKFDTSESMRTSGECGIQGRWFRDKDGSRSTATKIGDESSRVKNPPA